MLVQLAIALLLASTSVAQSESDGLDELFSIFEEQDRVGVRDVSGRMVALREAPGSHWVIDSSVIQTTPGIDLWDMLRTVPGMVPRELSLNHAESNFRLLTSMPDLQTLVVVDGRSVSADGVGAFFDRKMLDLRDVERIELVNGPASTLYGPNALYGALSIERKKPKLQGDALHFAIDSGMASGSPTTQQSMHYGALANAHASFDQGWGTGGLRLSANGNYMPSFGYATDSGTVIGNEHGRKVGGTADLRQRVSDWELRAQLDANAKRSVYEVIDGGVANQQDYAVNLIAEREKLAGADDRLLIEAWARHYRLEMELRPAGLARTPFNTDMTAFELRSVYTLPTFASNALSVGAQARMSLNHASYALSAAANQLRIGVFAQDTFKPIESLVLTLGLRVDTVEDFVTPAFRYFSAAPRASVAWLINNKHSLRFDYASATRTPTVLERAAILTTPSANPIFIGSPQLRQETNHGFSLAYLGEMAWVSLRLEAYVMHTLNNIAPTFVSWSAEQNTTASGQPLYQPPAGGHYKYPFYVDNLPYFWIPGALARLELKPTESITAFINYTFVPTEVMHYAGAGVAWRIARFGFSGQLYYNDQAAMADTLIVNNPARIVANVKATYALDADGHWLVGLSGINLLDIRFFRYRSPTLPANYGDANTGERVGPRLWLTLEARL